MTLFDAAVTQMQVPYLEVRHLAGPKPQLQLECDQCSRTDEIDPAEHVAQVFESQVRKRLGRMLTERRPVVRDLEQLMVGWVGEHGLALPVVVGLFEATEFDLDRRGGVVVDVTAPLDVGLDLLDGRAGGVSIRPGTEHGREPTAPKRSVDTRSTRSSQGGLLCVPYPPSLSLAVDSV